MAINLPSVGGNQPISVDLMYQFYDNKAITPQIRAALQKRENEEASKATDGESSKAAGASSSKFGPATRVSITDQIIRMNIANNSTKMEKKEDAAANSETTVKKPSRYDVLTEVKKSVAEREAAAKAEKDAKLKEIADKVTADEEAKKKTEENSAEG
jgi:hypothetical protein